MPAQVVVPGAYVQRRARLFRPRPARFGSHGRADDVNQRVNGPDFVKMNLIDRNIVDLGSPAAEFLEDRNRGLFGRFTEHGFADDRANL